MDGKALAHLAAIIIVAVAGTAAAIYVARNDTSSSPMQDMSAVTEAPSTDSTRATLQHCLTLGELATYDPTCLAAWDANRRHFLNLGAGH